MVGMRYGVRMKAVACTCSLSNAGVAVLDPQAAL